jgi:hypothetical protein
VCESTAFVLLAPVWRNYHLPAEFRTDAIRWFAECATCGTVVMLPLHDDFDTGGTVYYDQGDIDTHARHHFESFQKPNYDHIRAFLRATHPPAQYHRWLDVGSVGYPTTFDDYEFTTIEPDARAARVGEAMFRTGRIHPSTLDTWTDDRPYDGILFNNSFYCLTDPGRALEKARGLLRPGGRLVITLSSSFADAVSDSDDGRLLLIEQVIFGETLQVYYNQHSLTYLAGRHGFRLVNIADVPAYGYKTMKAHVFERADEPRVLPELLEGSRLQMARKWAECFDGFAVSIVETLDAVNTPETVLAGSLTVIRDLMRYGDLSQVRGVLPFPDAHMTGASLNGLRVLSAADLREADPDDYKVVVCGFRDPHALGAELRRQLGDDIQLYLPTRRSGMEFIDFSFRDGLHPSKGFVLREQPRGWRRVRLQNKRVVVYGAGAGGREALGHLGESERRSLRCATLTPADTGKCSVRTASCRSRTCVARRSISWWWRRDQATSPLRRH